MKVAIFDLQKHPNLDIFSILRQKTHKKYLRYADTVYWNYDLDDTIKKYVLKSTTQQKRDITKIEQMAFLRSRLLGEIKQ